jgi:hypothetical protein
MLQMLHLVIYMGINLTALTSIPEMPQFSVDAGPLRLPFSRFNEPFRTLIDGTRIDLHAVGSSGSPLHM